MERIMETTIPHIQRLRQNELQEGQLRRPEGVNAELDQLVMAINRLTDAVNELNVSKNTFSRFLDFYKAQHKAVVDRLKKAEALAAKAANFNNKANTRFEDLASIFQTGRSK
jgi:uncharacterized protein YoxC